LGEEQAPDEVAIRVATIYKQFLHQFDIIYVASIGYTAFQQKYTDEVQ